MSEVDKQVSELMSIYTSHSEQSVLSLVKKLIKKVNEYISGGAVVYAKMYKHNVCLDNQADVKITVSFISTSSETIDSASKLISVLGDYSEFLPLLGTGVIDDSNVINCSYKGNILKYYTSSGSGSLSITSGGYTFTDYIMEI